MENIDIQKALLSDVEWLQKIGRQTFSETFSAENTAEDMDKYVKKCFTIDRLTAELKNKDSEFYFARYDHRIIGYLKLNVGLAQTELKEEGALEIERIYVLKEFHGKSVGQRLYEQAMKVAREKNMEYVWLGVWERNQRAIRFYSKNGFTEFGKHFFELGHDRQTDVMMKLSLKR